MDKVSGAHFFSEITHADLTTAMDLEVICSKLA